MGNRELSADCIDNENAFRALKSEWNSLASETQPQSVFLRHEWFDAAWQWRRADRVLRILRIRDNGKTIGICPLVLRRKRSYLLPLRVLEFLTVPDTQLCDILAAPQHHAAVTDAIVKQLYETRRSWDVASLDYISSGSSSVNGLVGAVTKYKLLSRLGSAHKNYFIDLKTTWQAFYSGRSRRLKKANNLIANRLRRAVAKISIEWRRSPDLDSAIANETLEKMIIVSRRSWKTKTGLSLDNPGPNAFFRSITQHALTNGWLSLWILFLDGRPAATEFQLSYLGQLHALRADYDEGFKELSPGSYLNWKLIEALFDAGMVRYCLGPGANPYKLHWTEECERLQKVMIYGTSIRARALALMDVGRRTLARRFAGGKSLSMEID